MGLNSTKLNILINEFNEEKLVELLGLTLTKVLYAARETNSLGVIAKNIFIENDKIKLNKCSLSHEEWREFMFNDRVEETFLSQKSSYERVSFWYWLLSKKEEAMEYYYQLCNNETSFPDLKKRFSDVRYYANQQTIHLDTTISKALRYTKLNVPTSPIRTSQGYLILQKDSFKNAALDEKLRQKLLDRLENEWFLRELTRMLEET
tara:strand:+ start:6443 stop:7060 length:618 start_codon:yes stop_codon:yes gene_type:complete